MVKGVENQEYSIESLTALSSAMRSLQRCGSARVSCDFYVYKISDLHEFKNNHCEWVSTVKPDLGPRISERDYGILVIPSVLGPPPKLKTEPSTLETFRARAFSLLSIAGVSGFCQVLLLNGNRLMFKGMYDLYIIFLCIVMTDANSDSPNHVDWDALGNDYCSEGMVGILIPNFQDLEVELETRILKLLLELKQRSLEF
ncbi:hypothetical protein LguiA_026210 [Lonicera macranthoides]